MADAPWQPIKNYLNSPDSDDALIADCWEEAGTLVTDFVGDKVVPATILGRAILEVAAALYHRRNSQNGIAGFTNNTVPVFTAKDPMNAVYPMLRRYVGWF